MMRRVVLLALFHTALCFSPSALNRSHNTRLEAKKQTQPALSRFFGFAAALSIFSFQVPDVSASGPGTNEVATPFFSSSVHVADQIKTLDFSLPSSYDSLSDAKASVANVDDLSIGYSKPAAALRTTAPSKPPDGDSGGPGVLGSVLPSMNKSGPATSSKVEKDVMKNVKTVDTKMPTYNF